MKNLLYATGLMLLLATCKEDDPAPKDDPATEALPVAAFSAPAATGINQPVAFQNASINATSYRWTFGDGSTSTAAQPVHTFMQAGTYQVKLVARNTNGQADSVTHPVQATLPPTPAAVANFTTTGTLQNFTPVQFSGSSTPAATAYAWNFGDNTTAQGQNPAHVFRNAGTYTVTLTATGPSGAATVSKQLTLAQADTIALLMDDLVAQYRFGKAIRKLVPRSGINPTITRIRDTTFAVTRVNRQLLIDTYYRTDFTTAPVPVEHTAYVGFSNHHFTYVSGANAADLYFQRQGDSLIYVKRNYDISGTNTRIYYGRRIR